LSHPDGFDPRPLDLERMHVERVAKLRAEMGRQEQAALLVLGSNAIKYAAGVRSMPADQARAAHERSAVLLTETAVHVFTPFPEGVPPKLEGAHVHPALDLETREGVHRSAARLRDVAGGPPDGPVGLDEHTGATFFELADALGWELVDGSAALAAAKLCKTADELECIRRAQQINERAMARVQLGLRPGVRQTELTARLFENIYALGATANGIDPIWQVMPARLSDGPYTTHGDIAFPTCTTDRILRQGDVIWVDSGLDYQGYASDFGRTWIVGEPSERQRDQFRRWCAVIEAVLEGVKPGATGAELTRRATEANGGSIPWPQHFYLIHGVGTEPAEMPLIGTDLGPAFDEQIVLAPGMVLVLEPAIWDDGAAGYRSEEIVAVTDDGYAWLSGHPYTPFEGAIA
jgi:Xaa-Pro aminopeptidase